MCGIAGLVSHKSTLTAESLIPLVQGISHRGPDDQGVYLSPDQRCALGHTRLSIIDLSADGHQPMFNAETGNTIVFNGEIYNFKELRKTAEAAGYRFKSHTDTEVILALYHQHGLDCLHHLRGMFAFAIWDRSRQRLFFARDRLGKRPFHYSHGRDGFAFCSEIDPLARHAWVDRELDLRALDYYLQLQSIPAPHTIYRGIRKLPPAHFGVFENGQLSITRYWQPEFRNKLALSESEALEAFAEKFTEAVRIRMVADVPVGALLSGGVDSSVVVATMARLSAAPIHTFSVGFGDPAYDETRYSLQAADICGTIHTPIRMDCPDPSVLPELVRRYGEPYGDYSALPSFAVCAAARQDVTVVLNGDGGDELLGGYPRYALSNRALNIATGLMRRRGFPGHRLLRLLLQPRGFPFRKIHRHTLRHTVPDYASLMMYLGVGTDGERHALLGIDNLRKNLSDWRLQWLQEAREHADNPVDSMLWIDNHTYLPDDLLVKMDIAAMHCGLEARSPFLDHELVEFCARLPIKHKVHGGVGKYLIKRLTERYFPHEFVHRRKMGFSIPLRQWMHGPLHALVKDILLDPVCMAPLDREQVRRQFAIFERGTYPLEPVNIWILFMYGMWRRHCALN